MTERLSFGRWSTPHPDRAVDPLQAAPTTGRFAGAIIRLIRVYQFFSRLTPRTCRFHPTCSQYAVEAISKYGPGKGTWLAIKRISRCHPFHPGGLDPLQ
jgi:putative membrane protein insertion efficiency factor